MSDWPDLQFRERRWLRFLGKHDIVEVPASVISYVHGGPYDVGVLHTLRRLGLAQYSRGWSTTPEGQQLADAFEVAETLRKLDTT